MMKKSIPDEPLINLSDEQKDHIRELISVEHFKHSREDPNAPRGRGRPRSALPADLKKVIKVWPILSRFDRKQVWTVIKRILTENRRLAEVIGSMQRKKGSDHA